MFAAAIGVDRTVETEIGRIVAGDGCAALIGLNGGSQFVERLLKAAPAIVARLSGEAFVAPGPVACGTPPLARLTRQVCSDLANVLYMSLVTHVDIIAWYLNKYRTF